MSARRRITLSAAAGILAAGLALAPAFSATAATGGSNWWYDWYDVGSALSAGADGSGVKIAVIDGQINSSLPVFAGADLTVHEPGLCGMPGSTTAVNADSVHGTDVTALLVGNGTGTGAVKGIAPKAHVTFYGDAKTADAFGCFADVDGRSMSQVGLGIRQAIADGNRIISLSQGSAGKGTPGDLAEIARAIALGVVIVASNPNHASQSDIQFPSASNGVVAVSALQQDGTLQAEDDGTRLIWPTATVVAPGVRFTTQADPDGGVWGDNSGYISGASLSTPLVAGMLALTAQKYPKATGNQLIQSLIHNTTADDHPLKYEHTGYGYGPASVGHLLRVDPTQYPDQNPLMDKKGFGTPTAADVARAKSDGSGPGVPGGTGSGGGSAFGAAMPFLVVGGVIVLLVIVGVIVLIVVLARRGRPMAGGTR